MSATSFLFNGVPPANINTTSAESATLPTWYQEYLQGLMGTANALAATPYPQFTGPMLAPFNDTQNQAFSMTGALPGATSGAYGQANTALGAASGVNIPGAVQPYINASTSAANNPTNALNPYLGQASDYLNRASNTATPGGIQNYLNPYTSAVTANLQRLGSQAWNNTIMPSIQNEFVSAGQFGSGRNAEILGQAANTWGENLTGQMANTLEQGYNMAGTQAGTQAGVLGAAANTSLQQGTAAGAAAGQEAGIQQNAGALADTAAQQQGALSTNVANTATNLANSQQNTALQNAAAQQTVGNQQQTQTQNNLTTAYNQFQQQAAYPEQQATFMSDIIRGLVPPASTSVSSNQPPAPFTTLSPSVGNQLSALFGGGALTGHARGGMVKGYAKGGPVHIPGGLPMGSQPQGAPPMSPDMPVTSPPQQQGGHPDPRAVAALQQMRATPTRLIPYAGGRRQLQNGIVQNEDGSITIPYAVLQQIGLMIKQGRSGGQIMQGLMGALSTGGGGAPPGGAPPQAPQMPAPRGALSMGG